MRTRVITLSAVLALASADPVLAQVGAVSQPPSTTGSVDVGIRASSTSGDEARFERYRDLRTGANLNFDFARSTDAYQFDVRMRNVGYRDGFYGVNVSGGRFTVSFLFDQTPLNYSYRALTPYQESSPGTFTLDQAVRSSVQSRTPGVVGIPTTATQLLTPSIYRGLANPIERLGQRRDTLSLALSYAATREVALKLGVSSYARTGSMPWAGAFAFNNTAEVPLSIDNRTTDLSAGVEWVTPKRMLRIGYDRSIFSNAIQTLVWDNPLRATDWNATAGTGYDPSGYINGNGPAQGRMALAPNNTVDRVSFTGLVKLPARSTVNGSLALTDSRQDDALIPWTINPVVAPYTQPLPRDTAEARIKGVNAAVTFVTRPTRRFNVTARYRYNDHHNTTPDFASTTTVRFDAVPYDGDYRTHHLDITRHTLDASASFNLPGASAIRFGYGHDSWDRTGRAFASMADDSVRVSWDTTGNQWVSVRALYEHTTREGSGFTVASIEDGGGQPGLRYYDESNRKRHRGTLLATVMPTPLVDVTLSVAYGQDTYDGPGHEFGLLDNQNTVYTATLNLTPREQVAVGISVGRETYSSFQTSRNANPPPDPSWTDPNRTWNLDHDETVNHFGVTVDLLNALPRTDLRFSYDFSDSDQAFVHSGPRVTAFLTNVDPTTGRAACSGGVTTCFEALPNVTNTWQMATLDIRYAITQKLAVGVGYWFEKFEVDDYATISLPDGSPRVDYLGGLTLGYGNRPYTGGTGSLRLFYRF